MTELEGAAPTGSGLAVLIMLLRFQGVAADPEQIRHQFGATPIGFQRCCAAPNNLASKRGMSKTTWERLASTPLPAIAALRDGGFLLLGKA